MKPLFVKLSIACTLLSWSVIAGEQGNPPESFGAHWARVTDEAQIGFVVDAVQSAARGSTNRDIIRTMISRNVHLSSLFSHMDQTAVAPTSTRASIAINGATAVSHFRGGALSFEKIAGQWTLTGGQAPPAPNSISTSHPVSGTAVSAGETLIETPVSREYNIDRLSKTVTQQRISRTLFGAPEKSASYYFAHYTNTAPFVTATYIQFVTDPSWNRILYGNMDRWIRSYDNVAGPSAIAVDPEGRVFIGETGNQRVTVMKITGEGADATLQPQFTIGNIQNPTDIAHSDNGTPLDIADDFLYVADASRNTVSKFALGASNATLTATFDGFDNPTSIAVGRWNGSANSIIYVVDQLGKRIRVFNDQGSVLSVIGEIHGNYSQYFKSLKVDHFGNVYVVDNVNSQIIKYTSSLEFLDSQGGDDTFAAVGNIDIPFGRIVVDGQGTYWAGFDQLFAVERWSNDSGAQRRTLGLKMKDISFAADDDVSTIRNTFTMTDFGRVNVTVSNSNGQVVRTLTDAWMVSGGKQFDWDRRTDAGVQVGPGTYRYQVTAVQTYRDDPVISQTQITLPMYYHEDCGSATPAEDQYVVRGTPVRWGTSPSQSVEDDPSSVIYTFSGLDASSDYEVSAEYVAHDDVARVQDMTVNGASLHDPVPVSRTPLRIDYIKLPKAAFAGGQATISINARGGGSATVSQLWIRETGRPFGAQQIVNLIPSAYRLDQNYPNPFNPTTTIRYALPKDGPVTLRVFDITGREVATLVNENKPAGTYEVHFDAKNGSGRALASGVYFYQIQSNEYSETKKLLLLK